ncbi:NAD(P)-binding protein [Metschnikowia bicuspidata var. bicuspidata NRRL YB-4993]|uniref:NAD(P)-binding protein n=1 Tax=Metschnikowia bicuspidata var. bicuspidata NRRL YB-4993 TaxID=869754 RepID=A0A1A0H6G2_9ASCO|nr:NAD(P)-binding protein [Metschnikowia bicuspidata var. bicuspidata NRRL YB-4993]OBA19621.1 NAD(P)-binding protein [Metschnikowia bicuspidata var. bicuspidata NRRL YB-4993]
MTLNVGIVGTGIFASSAHLPVIQAIDNLRPVAAYNRTKSKADTFAAQAGIAPENVYGDLEELLENPDIDFIDALLPVQNNVDIVKSAIKHNKPIMFEKPIAANMKQAREIVELAASTDLPIGILEQWAFFSSIAQMKDILSRIGNIQSFTYKATGPWNSNNKYLATAWRQKPEHIGGYLSDGGVHQLALLTEILGNVEYISGHTKQVRKESGTDDILFSTLKLTSGIIGTFTYGSAFGATEKSTSLIVYGDNGSITYDFSPSLPKPTITYQTGANALEASDKIVLQVDEVNAIEEEFKNFATAVEAKDKSLVTVPPAKAFHHLAIIAAALESSQNNGSSVKVETL